MTQQKDDALGLNEIITPEDIEKGESKLTTEQMSELKRRMRLDLSGSDQFFTKDKWNDRHFQAEQKIKSASKNNMLNDSETKEHVKTYLKGKFVEPIPKHITWESKDKLIKKIKTNYPHMKISQLKKMPRKELLSMVQIPPV